MTDKEDPNRDIPYTAKDEPTRPKLLKEMVAPKCTKSNIESDAPKRLIP
jgi:hypothetical protein